MLNNEFKGFIVEKPHNIRSACRLEALQQLESSNKRVTQADIIFKHFMKKGSAGSTDHQLYKAFPSWLTTSVTRARNDLVRSGHLVESGKRQNFETGASNTVFVLDPTYYCSGVVSNGNKR